jgi:hypothetical protein
MLKPGDPLTLCKKVRGRKKGEPLVRIADVQVVSVRREPLNAITPQDVAAEGFPGWTPVICGRSKGFHDVAHEQLKCTGSRGGRGYLLPSITQASRRFDACAAGSDARFVC